MTEDDAYDEAELREARALAAVLDGGDPPAHEVRDAVDAAELVALLKAPLLEQPRKEAVLAETERRIAAAKRRTRARLTWIGSAAGALALAAAALLMVRTQPEPPRSAQTRAEAPAEVPAAAPAAPSTAAAGAGGPDHALRSAQLAWLDAPSPDAATALDRELAAYRGEQLLRLERRYGR